jgi:predicted RNA-binding protein YlqC (UPF0109 family)
MQDLIEYIANWIVEDEESVQLSEQQRGGRTTVRLEVAESDMGRVIGREGRLASAMRTMLDIAGDIRDERISLEIR